MSIKKLAVGFMALTLIAPVSLTGCMEKTDEVEVQKDVNPAPAVVPDRDVDVHVNTDNDQSK
jgi:hypothetical protein